jgi:hypothetical protein
MEKNKWLLIGLRVLLAISLGLNFYLSFQIKERDEEIQVQNAMLNEDALIMKATELSRPLVFIYDKDGQRKWIGELDESGKFIESPKVEKGDTISVISKGQQANSRIGITEPMTATTCSRDLPIFGGNLESSIMDIPLLEWRIYELAHKKMPMEPMCESDRVGRMISILDEMLKK